MVIIDLFVCSGSEIREIRCISLLGLQWLSAPIDHKTINLVC